jgi:hypothetical protein
MELGKPTVSAPLGRLCQYLVTERTTHSRRVKLSLPGLGLSRTVVHDHDCGDNPDTMVGQDT